MNALSTYFRSDQWTEAEKFESAVVLLAEALKLFNWSPSDLHSFAETLNNKDRRKAHKMISQACQRTGNAVLIHADGQCWNPWRRH